MSVVVPAAPEREPDSSPLDAGCREGRLHRDHGTRLAVDASVNEKTLARVLRAMKGLI
jgi:hypothetical protein